MYLATAFGITVGYHRLLTHRSFETYRPVEYAFAVLGLDGRAGRRDRLGRRPSQAPRVPRPGGRPAQPARRPRRRRSRRRCAVSSTRTWAGCSRLLCASATGEEVTRPTCSRTTACAGSARASSRSCSSAWRSRPRSDTCRQAFPAAELLHVYGTTETTPITTLLPHEERILDTPLVHSCGQPAMGVEVRVVNDAMDDLPPGAVGQMAVRSPSVMAGDGGASRRRRPRSCTATGT